MLLSLIKRAYVSCQARHRTAQKQEITENLLLGMKNVCNSYGVSFVMVYLSGEEDNKNHYLKFTQKNDIRTFDCNFTLTAERLVRGESHPNEIHHASWADCIFESISGTIMVMDPNE